MNIELTPDEAILVISAMCNSTESLLIEDGNHPMYRSAIEEDLRIAEKIFEQIEETITNHLALPLIKQAFENIHTVINNGRL